MDRVRTGHGKPGKSWNFRISFSRPGKSWNLSVGHGKSWKMVLIVQNKLGKLFFVRKRVKRTRNQEKFWKFPRKMVKFRSWETLKSHGKGHGKSWNFKSSKEYEPCMEGTYQIFHILVIIHTFL